MFRSILRIASLLLIPALVVDPAFAAGSRDFTLRNQPLFAEQALSGRPVGGSFHRLDPVPARIVVISLAASALFGTHAWSTLFAVLRTGSLTSSWAEATMVWAALIGGAIAWDQWSTSRNPDRPTTDGIARRIAIPMAGYLAVGIARLAAHASGTEGDGFEEAFRRDPADHPEHFAGKPAAQIASFSRDLELLDPTARKAIKPLLPELEQRLAASWDDEDSLREVTERAERINTVLVPHRFYVIPYVFSDDQDQPRPRLQIIRLGRHPEIFDVAGKKISVYSGVSLNESVSNMLAFSPEYIPICIVMDNRLRERAKTIQEMLRVRQDAQAGRLNPLSDKQSRQLESLASRSDGFIPADPVAGEILLASFGGQSKRGIARILRRITVLHELMHHWFTGMKLHDRVGKLDAQAATEMAAYLGQIAQGEAGWYSLMTLVPYTGATEDNVSGDTKMAFGTRDAAREMFRRLAAEFAKDAADPDDAKKLLSLARTGMLDPDRALDLLRRFWTLQKRAGRPLLADAARNVYVAAFGDLPSGRSFVEKFRGRVMQVLGAA